MFARTSIGGLLLEDVDGWTFSAQDGVIAGRYYDDPGILRITTIAANKLPLPVTHAVCLAHAAELMGLADAKPSDWQRRQSITGPYGSANFDRGSDRVYSWYCCRSPGVIIGTYSCSVDLSRTSANYALRLQCHSMITTALFDRRVFGGDDEITRLLIALLSADDAKQASNDKDPR